MDNFFQDEFKVNMGRKTDMTRQQLLEQNRKERVERETVRRNAAAATMTQKVMKSHVSNKQLTKSIFKDDTLKLIQTIMVFKAASVKQPAQRDAIFLKGIFKF